MANVAQRADLRVSVPPIIRYASPYQNSIFEVFEIPMTIVNDGAQTGTVLSLDLEVTGVETGKSKLFYSAGLGPWSLAKVKGEGLAPFTPISLTGRASQSDTVLFYARTDSRVLQIVEAPPEFTDFQFLLRRRAAGASSGASRSRSCSR